MFIVFEGLDGSGSSTQAKLLEQYFTRNSKKTLLTKEPTDKKLGLIVRDTLQHKIELSPTALQLLFCADRAEHISSEISPALNRGENVISDRYFFSTIAFGSLSMDISWLEDINSRFLKPDIIFLFKLAPEECIKRIEKRGSEKELFEKANILEKVWKSYEYLAGKHDNCIVIDASKGIDEIHQEIISHLSN